MNAMTDRRAGGTCESNPWARLLPLLAACLLAACGGGGQAVDTPEPAAGCDPSDAATASACGTVLIGITDADGDFLSYTVEVLSIELETANGRVVETLPAATRIDFAQYVDLTEFVAAATVPPANYVAGSVTLDYGDAEVVVEAGGDSKDAVVVDSAGAPLGEVTLDIRLDDRNHLIVTRGRSSLLTVDFDLAASHDVDVAPTPAVATAAPFIVAEIDPVDEKDIRVRGPLVEVDEDAMSYTIELRPFHRAEGDFGRVEVHVTETTQFEVNESPSKGVEGLRALQAAGAGTPTVAQGTLDVAERAFTADVVLGGSSVPGTTMDGVKGSVIARSGEKLVVRGATVIPSDAVAWFHDDVIVTIGPETTVFKAGSDTEVGIDAISVGQRVTIRGEVVSSGTDGIDVDATQGAVRLEITHLSGLVNTVIPGQLDMELQAIDRRRASVFDFSGTGQSPELDADPANYEVATGALELADAAAGRPVVVYGFPGAFGAAPPDFEGRTVVDHAVVRSALGVGWGAQGTLAPFLSIGVDGLVLDNQNPDIDERHFIKQGPVLIDLTQLDSGTRIVPRPEGRALFVIKTADGLRLYTDFAEFVSALGETLDGATAARSLYARGIYDAEANVFTAWKLGVHLLPL